MGSLQNYPRLVSAFECIRAFVLLVPVILVCGLLTWSFYVYNTYYLMQFFADAPFSRSTLFRLLKVTRISWTQYAAHWMFALDDKPFTMELHVCTYNWVYVFYYSFNQRALSRCFCFGDVKLLHDLAGSNCSSSGINICSVWRGSFCFERRGAWPIGWYFQPCHYMLPFVILSYTNQ